MTGVPVTWLIILSPSASFSVLPPPALLSERMTVLNSWIERVSWCHLVFCHEETSFGEHVLDCYLSWDELPPQ